MCLCSKYRACSTRQVIGKEEMKKKAESKLDVYVSKGNVNITALSVTEIEVIIPDFEFLWTKSVAMGTQISVVTGKALHAKLSEVLATPVDKENAKKIIAMAKKAGIKLPSTWR
jgi:hypothetical protein